MNYYKIRVLNGNFDEGYTVAEIQDDYDFDSDDSVWNIFLEEEINIDPNINFRIKGKGKLCDAYTNPIGIDDSNSLLVSSRLYTILMKINLPKHQVFKAKATYKKEFLDYYFIHFLENVFSIDNLVNFEKSVFYSSPTEHPHLPPPTGLIGKFQINSSDEFSVIRGKKENNFDAKYIDLECLYVKQKSFFDLDIIYIDLQNWHKYFIISEKLALKLKEENIIGISIEELSYQIFLS